MQSNHNLSVEDALRRILVGVAPTEVETVAIEDAFQRTLALPLAADLTQPPFDASAMDGYAVRKADIADRSARLSVIGEAAAGHPFEFTVGEGQAVRIFTGAPVPTGADAIVIQENVRIIQPRSEAASGLVEIIDGSIDATHIRPRGGDFEKGRTLLPDGRRLGAREITLAAAMGHATLAVRRRPLVAVLATGDELVSPGTRPDAGQIVCSNHLGVAALVHASGGRPLLLGIARDTRESLREHIERANGADVLVTIGGASVGDHDLVGPVLRQRGMGLDFWKIAMRPGKPLMFGRLGSQRVLGLPGNPVSSLVCARLFLVPLIARLLGRSDHIETRTARTAIDLEANGPRAHYMRATVEPDADGVLTAMPAHSQDSSLLSPLAQANAFLVRPPHAPAAVAGSDVPILTLDF